MDSLRVDKWLWAARFFRTRSLAGQAVRGGKVTVNGERAKPAREVRVNDEVRITRGETRFTVTVLALDERRGPAVVARQLYSETDASQREREALAEQQRLARMAVSFPARRPDRRERRALLRTKTGR